MMTDKELANIDNYLRDTIMKIEKIREELEEFRANKTPELPKLFEGEEGSYVIGYDGRVFNPDIINKSEEHLIFRSFDEAEKYLDKSERIHRLLKKMSVEWNGDWIADWYINQTKYYVIFDYECNNYDIDSSYLISRFIPVFKSRELAQQAIKKLKELGY